MKRQTFSPKHAIMLAILSIASIFHMSAQHYRGFANFESGFPISNSNGTSFKYGMSTVSFGLSTSHGAQLSESLFIGAGVGLHMNGDGEKINGTYSFPLYLNLRYDFKSISKTNFFIACKIGYQFYTSQSPKNRERALQLNSTVPITFEKSIGLDVTSGEAVPIYTQDVNTCSYYKNSFYIEPSVGLRLRLSSKIGLNIAVFYSPIRQKDYTFEYVSAYYHDAILTDEDIANLRKGDFTVHKIGVSVGIDF